MNRNSRGGGGCAGVGRAGGHAGGCAGWRVSWVAETGSTNADLKQLVGRSQGQLSGRRQGQLSQTDLSQLDGTVLAAEYQTQGRGRLDRKWESPPGENLLFSVLLCPGCEPGDFGWLTQLAALAVADVCEDLCGQRARLKWPNDVVVGGRKLAGILAEVVPGAGAGIGAGTGAGAVVLGIGLNVNWPAAEMSGEVSGQVSSEVSSEVSGEFRLEATSLAQLVAANPDANDSAAVAARRFDPKAVLDVVLDKLAQRLELLKQNGWQGQLRQLVKDNSATLGRDVVAELAQSSIAGQAVDITDTGALVVKPHPDSLPPGLSSDLPQQLVEISAGDVVHATLAKK